INIDSNLVKCEDYANVDITFVELSRGKRVTNLQVNLEGENSASNIKTIYMVEGNDNLDINYIMSHKGRRTQGNMDVYGVLKDEAKKTFRGTLDFKKGSSKSKGSEIENTLLLSSNVVNKAVPLLLCDEDDVEGQHAATSGKVDDNKLFYLMSRGFSQEEAKKLIIESMFNPVIETIPVEHIREKIKIELAKRLQS
ncbi:SufD family Fe-S cluster assembly protein, partial [Romboutsia sp.]|uniref:SufD family Fe-S cluster assembly protein n=1 Tax=Romboutsia sp. TaxID=1965302 RepID=UPI003F2F2B8F